MAKIFYRSHCIFSCALKKLFLYVNNLKNIHYFKVAPIAENNLRITSHSRIGKVIRDRGTTNYPDYDTVQFCNLTHAETLLTLSPHSVRYMPCNAVLYAFEGKTVVSTHLLPTDTGNPELDAFSDKMNGMLKQIVDFAIEE